MKSTGSGKNRIEPMSSESWTTWVPREELAPVFERVADGEHALLKVASSGDDSQFGKWLCQVTGIPGCTVFDFSVEYLAERIEYESVSVHAILSWKSREGDLLRREYVDELSLLEEGWKRLQKTGVTPENSWSVTVELAFRWDEAGVVTWRNPELYVSDEEQGKGCSSRMVRVATTSILTRRDPARNLEAMLRYLDEAGRAGADIVCLTETFYGVFADIPPHEICQPIPGKLTRIIGEKAKEYGMYIILSMFEREGKRIYNTAVVLDRMGEIAGKYRKVHLPLAEVEEGISPGNEYKVFDTDFGRIGIIVCWDQAFPEAARITADKGAEIIFIPTIGDEPLQTRARAKDNGVYVVVAGMYGPSSSRIIDPYGEIIATVETQNPDAEEGICVADIDLNKHHYTHWLSLGPCDCEHKCIFRKERRVDTYK